MQRSRIEYEVEGGKRIVTFERGGVVDAIDFPPVPVLLIQVDDDEDADAIVAAIEKVDRPKKAKKRVTRSPAPVAEAQPPASDADGARALEVPKPELPPRCMAPDCPHEGTNEGEGRYCAMHWSVDVSIRREWHTAFLKAERQEGAKKARGIRKQLEGAA